MESYICIKGVEVELDSGLSMETVKNKLEGFVKEEEPEIRHGDYGVDNGSQPVAFMAEGGQGDEPNAFWKPDGKSAYPAAKFKDSFVIFGNVFDDVKAKKDEGEDLREFTVGASLNDSDLSIGCACEPKDLIYFSAGKFGNHQILHFKRAKAKQIHRNLGRVIATAEKDLAKDC